MYAVTHYPNGAIKSRVATLPDGTPHGLSEYWREDSSQEKRAWYVIGELHGEYCEWSADGSTACRVWYDRGIIVSTVVPRAVAHVA